MSSDIRVTFVLRDGLRMEVTGSAWQSVKDVAVANAIPGIVAACGGSCACATCHVYVDEQWMDLVGKRREIEEMALDLAYDVRPASRLGCQVTLQPHLDGLVITVADNGS